MKKVNIYIIVIFSLFFANKYVYAAPELTCIYKGGLQDSSHMLIQKLDGSLEIYSNQNDSLEIGDVNWFKIEDSFEVVYNFNTNNYNNKYLEHCPNYTRNKFTNSTYTFYFYDNKTSHLDYPLYKEHAKSYNIQDNSFDRDDDYSEEINNTNWYAKCEYEYYDMYFNDEKIILVGKEELIKTYNLGFKREELIKYYETNSLCPVRMYGEYDTPALILTENFSYTYYLTKCNNCYELPLENSELYYVPPKPEPKPPIKSCEDLLSENAISKINSIFNIIRIAIPILLIALGIFDFAKAVFSNSEEDMKKSQSKFIRRLIAAVVTFFIPIFINLLLNLANEVWHYINPNTCIK